MKTYIRSKHHKNSTPKHKTNGTTTELKLGEKALRRLIKSLKDKERTKLAENALRKSGSQLTIPTDSGNRL